MKFSEHYLDRDGALVDQFDFAAEKLEIRVPNYRIRDAALVFQIAWPVVNDARGIDGVLLLPGRADFYFDASLKELKELLCEAPCHYDLLKTLGEDSRLSVF